MIILDTNVLSELVRAEPSPEVMGWFATQPAPSLFTTAVTEAEMRLGVALLPDGRRRDALTAAVDAMFTEDLVQRVLPFDRAAALEFATIAVRRRLLGRPISQADCQIAAIARSRGAAVATRNTADFTDCGIKMVDPWAWKR